jgi:conjugative transfer region protein (TIGR03750 family)
MPLDAHGRRETTVMFLPHRLNRQPVIVRGLTADELWISVSLSAACGLGLGIVLAIVFGSFPLAPTMAVLFVAIGLFAGGGLLRRLKRGRPDTWLYRQMQWRLAQRLPAASVYVGGSDLIMRSGVWTTRRTRRP